MSSDALSLHVQSVLYFTMLDVAHSELKLRLDQDSFTVHRNLEQYLLSGVPHDTIKLYPEIVFDSLTVQLPMFRSSYEYKYLAEADELMGTSSPEIRGLFSEVWKLIRLLMVSPASSCEAERSFSAVRRLKTYLYGAP
jgi:hypothetical protein